MITNEQIAAGAAVLCDHGKPIGRNAAISVFDAMQAAGAQAATAPLDADGLPPLPPPYCKIGPNLEGELVEYIAGGGESVYTAEQMQAYALQAQREAILAYYAQQPTQGALDVRDMAQARRLITQLRAERARRAAVSTTGDAEGWQKLTDESQVNFGRSVDVVLSNGVSEYCRRCNQVDWTQVQDWRYAAPQSPTEEA